MDRAEALAQLEPSLIDQFLAVLNTKPEAVRHTLEAFGADPVTVEPVTDYVTDVEERCHLFQELRKISWQQGMPSELNATMLASVMVAPVHEIRTFLSPLRRGGGGSAKARDGYVSHIFPFAPRAKRDFGNLNDMLQSFWGAAKCMAWQRLYEDASITQSPKNHISMNHQLHVWFDKAKFALKPLRKTQNEIVIQWHWLRNPILKPKELIGDNEDILLRAGLTDRSWGTNIAHRKSGFPIQTGQTFVIRAKDPEDLPSFELLELQWNMLRIAAICGAGEATDEDYEDQDEKDYERDEVGDDAGCLAIREQSRDGTSCD
ncbi:hypothetical protein C8A01DRAFT_51106 [Parachaetomium inaequale]|uniref:HNH nuclease domain-containing protein n=1 Tax=Parachaetomium inaequale TaxID=2588326 RepID=A0AAN6P9M1_9PEZI|nr:hypothetical protein C8A01DRAFT_51106 [Parachaetomium inaequale]